MQPKNVNTGNYAEWLVVIKTEITANRLQAALTVNGRLLYLYWVIGHHILTARVQQNRGAKIIPTLAKDLAEAFPEMKGFSKRNLTYMRQFAHEWPVQLIAQQGAAPIENTPQKEITQQGAAQIDFSFEQFEKTPLARIPWSGQMVLLDKLNTPGHRLFYCQKIIAGNWSRKTLLNQLERQLHIKQGKLANNFASTLPKTQSELARDTFKDPYFFDFLQLGETAKEKEIEDELALRITTFSLKLGAGFAYMGKHYKLEAGGQDYYLDLLFYHTQLRCYITIALKTGAFKPEYAGKVQFYLAVLDDQGKRADDQPGIGLILCKEANKTIAEYALKDSSKPIGVAEYQLADPLHESLQNKLPSIDALKKHINPTKN